MDAPMQVGASLVDAPPGKPGGTDAPTADDRTILDAVRAGDMDAYGALYGRHIAAVRSLARRVARDRYEADDIVSEVFANSLRAIRNGRGPRDDARAYLLRSVRHTAGKLRSRKDSGRSEPVPIDRLDRPAGGEVRLRSDIEIALGHLPDRHRDVLWATCVEGRPATEVAESDGLDVSCVTSLTLRARRALGRSYLLQRTSRPEPTDRCSRIRTSMPGSLRNEVSPSTTSAINGHLDECVECREVYDEMAHLDRSMCSVTVVGLLVGVVRGWFRFGAPIAASVTKPLTSVMVAGAMVTGAMTVDPPVIGHDRSEVAEAGTDERSTSVGSGTVAEPIGDTASAVRTTDDGFGRSDDVDGVDDPDVTLTRNVDADDPNADDLLGPADPTGRTATAPAPGDAVPPRPIAPDAAPTDSAPVPAPDTDSEPGMSEPADAGPIPVVVVVDDVLTGAVEATDQALTGVTETVGDAVEQVVATSHTIVAETVSTLDQTLDATVDDVATAVEVVEHVVDGAASEMVGVTEPAGELVDDVLGDVLGRLPPPAPQDGPALAPGETVTELTGGTIDTVDSLFGVVGGGLGLLGN